MKEAKQYLPFEVDFINSDTHSELIERYGAQGLGIYFMVLMELRNQPGYCCRLSTIKGAARRCLADPEMLESVLREFGLFEFQECGDRIMISSVYIDCMMQSFDEKTRRFSSTANENTVTVERPVHGMSTVTHRIIINKIETKTTTSTTNKKAASTADVDAVAAAVVDIEAKAIRQHISELLQQSGVQTGKRSPYHFGIVESVARGQSCLGSIIPNGPPQAHKTIRCGLSGLGNAFIGILQGGFTHASSCVIRQKTVIRCQVVKCYRHPLQMLPSFGANAGFIRGKCNRHSGRMQSAFRRE